MDRISLGGEVKYYPAVMDDISIAAATALQPKRMLMSYHYFKSKCELVKDYVNRGCDIFLDSGAFSAMTLGKDINIGEYCEFITLTGVRKYAVLDVIGDAQGTYENFLFMRSEYDLSPIPVFHMGGTEDELKRLLAYGHVALGGLVKSSNIDNHVKKCWEIILKSPSPPKVHGFGLTNIGMMKKYPWHSVDSSSYTGCRRFGRQLVLKSGFTFKTLKEEEFITFLEEKYMYEAKNLWEDNRKRRYLEDFFAINDMKIFADYLTSVNKWKDFRHLTQQEELF